jgi:NADPH:quinone reductase-like Zn-dependent oxidoreductase
MPRAVRFDEYGGVDVLQVVDVERPVPGPGDVLVRVKAAGINYGEVKIRDGRLRQWLPATFPSGQGSDFAGVVEEIGAGVSQWHPGDEVIGFTDNRASHAELVVAEAENVIRRPPGVAWEVGGALFISGAAAWASVRAVGAGEGDIVVVAGAAGGVGSITVQLAKLAGAKVIGLAGEHNHAWLRDHGAIAVSYGDGLADRVRDAAGGPVDALIDTFGKGYVELALELGVDRDRINTLADFPAARRYGVKTEGTAAAANAAVLAELAKLVDQGKLDVPIARAFPVDQVREAFRELEGGHTRGKIVLIP